MTLDMSRREGVSFWARRTVDSQAGIRIAVGDRFLTTTSATSSSTSIRSRSLTAGATSVRPESRVDGHLP